MVADTGIHVSPTRFSPPVDAAVIDVGSNSVRLVIYRMEGRAIWSLFNEKVQAGLGRGVDQTGRRARGRRRPQLHQPGAGRDRA